MAKFTTILKTKTVQNLSSQSLYIPIYVDGFLREVTIKPKSSIEVPIEASSKIMDTFVRRRLIKVTVK